MNSRTPARSATTCHRSLVGRPHACSRSYASDWARRRRSPRRAPMPCTTRRSGRDAVTRGSFCRRLPAAALRGLANGALPCSISASLSSANASTGKKTSPRTSSSRARPSPVSRSGTSRDGAHVGRDVLAGAPVAAGRRPDQPAVLVDQVDRQPVDLELAQVAAPAPPGVALDPLGPGGQLLVGEHVVQAEHPLEVLDRR